MPPAPLNVAGSSPVSKHFTQSVTEASATWLPACTRTWLSISSLAVYGLLTVVTSVIVAVSPGSRSARVVRIGGAEPTETSGPRAPAATTTLST